MLGDRRRTFLWSGSVLDSVIGAFLTQNVADHLSSSAFMIMAARFPPAADLARHDHSDSVDWEAVRCADKAQVGWNGMVSWRRTVFSPWLSKHYMLGMSRHADPTSEYPPPSRWLMPSRVVGCKTSWLPGSTTA